MASAEQLLNEAQYAFQSISSGQSPGNKRNASRATSPARPTRHGETVPFDWAGLMAVILVTSKTVLAVIAFVVIFLFGIFGPFMFLMFIGLMFLTGPFRQLMKPKERQQMNEFVVRANAYIEERRKAGTGFT